MLSRLERITAQDTKVKEENEMRRRKNEACINDIQNEIIKMYGTEVAAEI